MIADFMLKPVQGTLFKTFRNVLMGWTHISEVYKGYIHPEERIGSSMEALTYADVTKGKSKSKIWKRKLAKEAVTKQNEQLLNEILLRISLN